MEPINYSGLLSQLDVRPLQQLAAQQSDRTAQAEAAQQRDAVRQLATQKFNADQQEHAAYLADVEAYKANPTPQALRDLAIRHPEQAKALQEAGDSYTARQKQDLIGTGFGALGALSAGKPDLAMKTLQDRVTALNGAGIDTSHTQAAIDLLKEGKTKEATAYLSYAMGGLVGADHAAGVLETLGVGGKAEDRRADNERADRTLALGERRAANAERATTAAIAGRARDDARADRKAAGGGKGRGTSGNSAATRSASLPAGFRVD